MSEKIWSDDEDEECEEESTSNISETGVGKYLMQGWELELDFSVTQR